MSQTSQGPRGTGMPPPVGEDIIRAGPAGKTNLLTEQHSLWRMLLLWLKRNTFAPHFLIRPLQHPIVGYMVAILLQCVTVVAIAFLVIIFPAFRFHEALMLLAVLLVALGWGAGPSIVATLVGAILLSILLIPPYLSLMISQVEDVFGVLLYVIVGLTISVLASQAQQARYRAEAVSKRLGDILDAIPETVVIYDRHGKNVHMNRIAREGIAGEQQHLSIAEMQEALKLLSSEGEPLSYELLPGIRALHGEIVHDAELSYTTLNGQHERFVSVSAAPLRSLSHGEIEGVVAVTRDLSALRLAERQAAERAQQLEAVFEAITDGLFIVTQPGRGPYLNRAGWQLLGITEGDRQAFAAGPPFQLLTEEGEPLPYEQWPEARIRDGVSLKSEEAVDVLMRRQDGSLRSLSITGGPLYDPKGQVRGGVIVCRDVTERRSLERRVQQALNALLHMAQVIVQSPTVDEGPEDRVDRARSITRSIAQQMAEQARAVLGCERLSLSQMEPETEVLYPLAITGLPPADERAWWRNQERNSGSLATSPDPTVAERLRRNEIVVLDYTAPPWSELPNPFHIRTVLIAPVCFNNQLLGTLTLDYGGREHVYTEDELSLTQAIAQMIALVIERDRLLTQQAESRATLITLRETNRMMDEFIGIAGHELRTPLTAVKTSVQLARRQLRRALKPAQLEHEPLKTLLLAIDDLLDRTERQVGRQNRLINDLLDVARLHSDRLELHPDLCDLNALLQEISEEQHYLTPTRAIRLHCPMQGEVMVIADAERLRQVITNYLSNALKYSEEDKEVMIQLEVRGTQARLAVQDHGPGLTEEQRQHIWERFYRVPGIEVKSGSGVGLGLGLHISRMMIERQGGKVGVQSIPGKGSTFWFTLPLAEG